MADGAAITLGTRLFVGGWVLILCGLVFAPLAFIGAWVAIAGMVLLGVGAIYEFGKSAGRESEFAARERLRRESGEASGSDERRDV